MNIARLHLQQAQNIVDKMRENKIVGYAVGVLNNLFIIKGHEPCCKCKGCPILREDGEFK